MKLVSRTFAVLMLFGLWGCLGVDLKMPLPDVKSLSKLADMANPVERKIEWQSPLLQQHHLVGRIWRPIDGRFVDEDTLVEDLVRSAFILLGEKHDNPDHHLLQAELIEELTDEGRRPAVVWEMISETRQPILDRFHAELSDDTAALGAALGWDVSGWPAWALYEPIAEAAMEDKLPMYGGGLPKLVVRALARGRPSFEFARRRRILGLHVPMAKELRARSMEQLFQGHCELMARKSLVPLFNVQRARDAVFAEHMLSNGARDGAILIAGNGHVRKDLGVSLFLRGHQPGVRITTVAFVEVQDEMLDPLDYGEIFSAPVLPFDYVWFTPRFDDKDPCIALRKKWGKSKKPASEKTAPEKTLKSKTDAEAEPKAEPRPEQKSEPNADGPLETSTPITVKPEEPAQKDEKPIESVTEPNEFDHTNPEEMNFDEMKFDQPDPEKAGAEIMDPEKAAVEKAGADETDSDETDSDESADQTNTPLPPVPRSKPPRP